MMRARRALENNTWLIQCRREELAQLDLIESPPAPETRYVAEVVKRPVPQVDADFDVIVLPSRAA